MDKIIAVARKELLLLSRDYSGLLTLFLMPAALVLIISLVQQNVMELTGESKSSIIIIDNDPQGLGGKLRESLSRDQGLALTLAPEGGHDQALAAVADGEYNGCLIINDSSGKELAQRLAGQPVAEEAVIITTIGPQQITFDPGLLPATRAAIMARLQGAFARVEMAEKLAALESRLQESLSELGIPAAALSREELGLTILTENLLTLEEREGGTGGRTTPGVVQQNVPAWAIFGMFFTVLPLGGGLLRERCSGVWPRFSSMPSSPLYLLLGKVAAYLPVGLLQFALIYLIGNKLFPLLGLPAFTMGQAPGQILLIVSAVSLAACGLGLLLGSLCASYEQLTMFGSIAIVIGAALGGIMVPVYAMPAGLQKVSVLSPLNWGLEAFHGVLLRDQSVWSAGSGLFPLLIFSALCLALALARINR
ncbi:MAG: ABC transporter permease [Thermodesulfobacteriota bacterium]